MLKPRQLKIGAAILSIGCLLLGFQNCAPATSTDSQGLISDIDGEVRIVDRWDKPSVEFVASSYQLPAQSSGDITLRGSCEDSDSAVDWEVLDAQGAVLSHGETFCIGGTFDVDMTSVTQSSVLNCGDVLDVRATSRETQDEAVTEIRLLCS